MTDYDIVTVDSGNVDELGFFCVKNKKHPGYVAKRSWLRQRFKEGLRIKLVRTAKGERAGFLEYVPWEYTWRVIHAPGYLVIHCIWVASKKFPNTGMASVLLKDCMQDAESSGKEGVAVVTSDGPWMARKEIFVKNGFEKVDEAAPHFQLLMKRLGTGPFPAFPQNWHERSSRYQGLQLLYTNQCPYIGKALGELPLVAERYGIRLNLVALESAAEARERMSSPYGMINLIYNGRLLADHPISATRFQNILQKELKLTRASRRECGR